MPRDTDQNAIDNGETALRVIQGKPSQDIINITTQALRSLIAIKSEKVDRLRLHLLRSRASAYVATKELTRAKDDIAQINKLKPRDYFALETLARLYENGDKTKARTCYQAAIKSFRDEKGPQLNDKGVDYVKRLERRVEMLTWVDPFQRLPAEVLLTIFEYIDFYQRVGLLRVCKEWNQLLSVPALWQHLDFNQSPQRRKLASRSVVIRAIGRAKGSCKLLKCPPLPSEDLPLVLSFLAKYNANQLHELEIPAQTDGRVGASDSILLKIMQLKKIRKLSLPLAHEPAMYKGSISTSLALPASLEELVLWKPNWKPTNFRNWDSITFPQMLLPPSLLPPNLRRLTVKYNSGSCGDYVPFGTTDQEYSHLEQLTLNGVSLGETDDRLEALRHEQDSALSQCSWRPESFTSLKELNLINCSLQPRCNRDSRDAIFPSCLEKIQLIGVRFWTTGPLRMPSVDVDLTKVKVFAMTECEQDAAILIDLLEALYTPRVTEDKSVEPVQHNLKELNVQFWISPERDPRNLPSILATLLDLRCRSLESLNMGFIGMDDEFVQQLASRCPALRTLTLHQLHNVSLATIANVMRSLTGKLVNLHLDGQDMVDNLSELRIFGAKRGITVTAVRPIPVNEGRPVRYGM